MRLHRAPPMRPKLPRLTAAQERAAYASVTERDGGLCVRCGRFGGNRDHRKNRSQGGRTTPANLQILCGTGTTGCHGWVTQNPAAAMAEGLTVPGWADPAAWPARRHGVWVVYDDDGGVREVSDAAARAVIDGPE